MRPLTLLQRQRITLSLFFTVAVGAVFTVATPAFVPWQVVDEKRAQALDQQRRQGKDFHVLENSRRRGGLAERGEQQTDSANSTSLSSTLAPTSSQGSIISRLTDRSTQGTSNIVPTASASPSASSSTSSSPSTALLSVLTTTNTVAAAAAAADLSSVSDPSLSVGALQDPDVPKTKNRRRRRKRKMVNEGWQELTGRTAREEKEKEQQHTQTPQSSAVADGQAKGENGGQEIVWKNKRSA